MFTSTTSMTTSTTATTTISITVTVYDGHWGLRCRGYSKFFFFNFTFFLAKSTFTIRTSTTTTNGQLLHVVITHTCTRMNRTQDAMLLEPNVCFFFAFFLILLTLFYRSPQSVNWPPPRPLFLPPQHIQQTQTGHHLDNLASSASGAFLFDLNTWCSAFKTIKLLGFLVI